jgi:DNA-binding transcriptional MerR regulator
MPATVPSMPTIGEIARRLTVPPHRVEYIIRAREIKPCGRAGNARVFDEAAVEVIATELDRIELAKSGERESLDAQHS